MGEQTINEVPDYKNQKLSQPDDAHCLCTPQNLNNLKSQNFKGNHLEIPEDNKTDNNQLKSLDMKTMFSPKIDWHNLLMTKTESHKTNGTKNKETRRSKNLFVDMLEGRFKLCLRLSSLYLYLYLMIFLVV